MCTLMLCSSFMKVLVTGCAGLVGGAVCEALALRGDSVVAFDAKASQDILDIESIESAAAVCDAIIHCAALLGTPEQSSSQIVNVNLQGTWNVLSSARSAKISKVVFLSSVDVLGVFKGERTPDFLPLDESHRCYPSTAYAISKYLAEEMCRLFTLGGETSIVCLRPPGVWESPSTYQWITTEREKRAAFEYDPFWEYGAFIDVRDLATACLAALEPAVTGFHSLFVSSDDITTSGRTSVQLSRQLLPNVEWRGGNEFDENPFRTLLSNDAAKRVLSWQPKHLWMDFASP